MLTSLRLDINIYIVFLSMRTITLDILNDKALDLLRDLELLKVIRLRKDSSAQDISINDLISKYKGSMQKQPISDVDDQLNSIRNEWE
ncbi:hypothetical protein SAMN05421827_12441 [Pedobacter terrae]|uniref:Uncharacterized protein n=2 Tax=Pedobacter terrae TaxID=405671 RepID=A0A1G8CBP8_9SPHI|nr:hypothetical protein SAMN05421827_11772 [Pedobacter terrae]SDH42874.1 hypothetical protein SAMN05421827_12441 [Pedobacter terrae]